MLREHTADPYDDSEQQAALLEERAMRICWLRRGEALPSTPFRTDGCSMWFDAWWAHCCVEHDVEYWCGGSDRERLQADRAFRACVAEETTWLAPFMYVGVRAGGVAWSPFYWRWGYGWPRGDEG